MTAFNDYILQQQLNTLSISGTGGITTTQSGSVWYINLGEINSNNLLVGNAIFSASGTYTLNHNISNINHFTNITLAGGEEYNPDIVAKVGTIYVKTGENTDTIYANGETYASGIAFNWMVCVSGSVSTTTSEQDSTQMLITGSGSERPAAGVAGREFICTDGVLPVRQIDTGSAWISTYNGFQCSLPPAASTLTSINSDASNTFSDINGGLYIKQVGRASTEFMTAYVTALPSAPYSFTIGYRVKILKQAAYCYVGMCLTDGAGATPKLANLVVISRGTGVNDLHIGNGYYSNPATWITDNSMTAASAYQLGWPVVFLNITDDNTNRIYKVSCDGVVWTTHELKGRTDYLTPTHGGLVIGQNGAGLTAGVTTAEAYIFHWSLG